MSRYEQVLSVKDTKLLQYNKSIAYSFYLDQLPCHLIVFYPLGLYQWDIDMLELAGFPGSAH